MQSIKKRYLLQNSIKSLIKDLGLQSDNISHFFIKTKLNEEIKYSKLNGNFYKSLKDSKDDEQKQISNTEYKKAKKTKISKIIKKQRYYLLLDAKKYTIDRYKSTFKGLNILEIEFKNQKEYENFIMPDFLQDFIQEEISGDERFYDKNLALLKELPKHSYNIYEIFKKLQRDEIDSLDSIIQKNMMSIDVLRVILYKLFLCLKEDNNKLIASNTNKNLYSFRSNITKIENILSDFQNIFDDQISQKIITNLHNILNETDTLQDLESLKENLAEIKSYFDADELIKLEEFIKQVKESLKDEKFKIRTFLTSREAQIVFRQLEIFIKEGIQVNSDAKASIYHVATQKLTQKLKKLKKSLKTVDETSSSSLQNFLISFSQFYHLCSEFIFIFDKSELEEFFKQMKEVEDKVELFFNLEKKKLIYTTYIENLHSPTLTYERVEAELNFEISKEQNTLLHDIKNSLQTISKETFKI